MAIATSSPMPREGKMVAPLQLVKTPAERSLGEQFDAVRTLGGAALARLRSDSFAQFERSGLPNRRVESWHYTDLRSLWTQAAAPAVAPPQPVIEALRLPPAPAPRLCIVDGYFIPELSDIASLPNGVRVERFSECRADAEWLSGILQRNNLARSDPIVALNLALMQDILVLEIEAGANVSVPLHIVSLISEGASHATYPALLVRVGAGARVTVLESQYGSKAGAHQRSNIGIIHVAEAAKVVHVAVIADESPTAINLSSLIVAMAAGASFDELALVTAGGLVRRQIFLRFEGPHARTQLRGLALLARSQHADTTVVVDHDAPHCESRELYKHIISEEATGVFQGKVIVRPGAQKTDGGMKSQALLLSPTAAMNNKPELEIFADDVVCGHGATVAQLNHDQLFYLMARGLPQGEAEALLLQAFATEAVEAVADETLRQSLDEIIHAWLKGRTA
jgi:Fe-S cluster assembly protein SufD